MKITKEETYRSETRVNMTDDMVRVTMTFTRNEWRRIKWIMTEWGRENNC
jgi:hypothetical protein